MLAALTSPEEVARSRHAALSARVSQKLEAEQPLEPEELALLRRAIVEIRAPSWEEEREEERRARGGAAASVEGTVGGEGEAPGAGTAAAPKLPRLPRRPRVDAADRKAIRKMAAAAADAKEQHQQQQAAARAVGERGAPQPFSLVSTLSAQLLPRTPDTGVTPLALQRLPESDFARREQGPGAPAQQWLREVASEATLRLQPQRRRVDHADVLRPLRSALAVLRTNPNPNPNPNPEPKFHPTPTPTPTPTFTPTPTLTRCCATRARPRTRRGGARRSRRGARKRVSSTRRASG